MIDIDVMYIEKKHIRVQYNIIDVLPTLDALQN